MLVNDMTKKTRRAGFSLPKALALPMMLVPDIVHSMALSGILNRMFFAQLREGEIDFLDQRTLCIRVRDAGTSLCLRKVGHRFIACHGNAPPDVLITGTLYDFAALATRNEDPDTLFFQRRLQLEGDTDLGLAVKNFLDGLDVDELPFPLAVRYALKGGNRLLSHLRL
jgi:predicted lipid carrier protein YhbT